MSKTTLTATSLNPDDLGIEIQTQKETFFTRFVDTVDRITSAPAKIRDSADSLNDFLIEKAKIAQRYGERLAGESGDVAKANLTENKIEGVTVSAGRWVRSNPVIALGAGALILFLIFKGLFK